MSTIEPDIQEAILDILPEDGQLATELMCQLLANMILSVPDTDINKISERIKAHLAAYEGT